LNDVGGYGQAQAGAAAMPGTGAVNAVKAFENVGQFIRGDSYTSIFDPNHNSVRLTMGSDRHRAPGMIVADPVLDQIVYSPSQQWSIRWQYHFVGNLEV
jgi:hypothetical protein